MATATVDQLNLLVGQVREELQTTKTDITTTLTNQINEKAKHLDDKGLMLHSLINAVSQNYQSHEQRFANVEQQIANSI